MEKVETGEGIGSVGRSILVCNGHVGLEDGEVLGPTSLAATEVFLGEEEAEGLMIGVEGEVFASFQVVSEGLASVDDSKELNLMR